MKWFKKLMLRFGFIYLTKLRCLEVFYLSWLALAVVVAIVKPGLCAVVACQVGWMNLILQRARLTVR